MVLTERTTFRPGADRFFFWSVLPYLLITIMAYVGARVVYTLGKAVTEARELGSYRLVERLGQGGMGEVWKAEHRLLARNAAIKLIRPEVMHDEAIGEVRERFRREAQTLASMKSRHTIEIFDYGVTNDGTFYYVMELLDGLDLEQIIVRYGAQPAARVIDRMPVHAVRAHSKASWLGLGVLCGLAVSPAPQGADEVSAT